MTDYILSRFPLAPHEGMWYYLHVSTAGWRRSGDQREILAMSGQYAQVHCPTKLGSSTRYTMPTIECVTEFARNISCAPGCCTPMDKWDPPPDILIRPPVGIERRETSDED